MSYYCLYKEPVLLQFGLESWLHIQMDQAQAKH